MLSLKLEGLFLQLNPGTASIIAFQFTALQFTAALQLVDSDEKFALFKLKQAQ